MTPHAAEPLAARMHRAIDAIDEASVPSLLDAVIGIASPSGKERDLAELICAHLGSAGVASTVQPLGAAGANVIAESPSGAGPAYLLYGQLDSAFDGDPTRDERLTGGVAGPEFLPYAQRVGDWVLGLGAENPKGYLVAAITAFEALGRAALPLNRKVLLGLCGGGMPALPPTVGFGVGCRALLDLVGRPALGGAVVPKPGFAVSWEEVGIAVYRITVSGDLGYTGIRHLAGGSNAIVAASDVIRGLERWFAHYSSAFKTTYTEPQGAVVAVAGGAPDRPAFPPATCDIYVDLRVPPGRSLYEVDEALDQCLADLRGARLAVAWARLVGIPGAVTDAEDPLIRCAIRSWEEMTGSTHAPRQRTSGYTDAVTLRLAGVPTARVGMPRPAVDPPGGAGFSMGQVHLPSLLTLTEWLVRTFVLLDDQAADDRDGAG